MITKTTEKARALFESIRKQNENNESLTALIEKNRKKWKNQGREFLLLDEIDSVIEEVRNER